MPASITLISAQSGRMTSVKYGTILVNWDRSGCIWPLAPESMLTLSSYMTMGNAWDVGRPLQTALRFVILVLVGGTVKVALALAVELAEWSL